MWASTLNSNGFARWRWVCSTVSNIILGSINIAKSYWIIISTHWNGDALCFQDGSWDGNLSSYFNMNTFLDIILTCVLQKGGKRRIVFSCFDPDICTMWVSLATEENECRLQSVQEHSDFIQQCNCWVAKMDDPKLTCCWYGFLSLLRVRHKQNKYPILFLTQGISNMYPELMDIRCQTTQIAISFAQSENILVSMKSNIYRSIHWMKQTFQCKDMVVYEMCSLSLELNKVSIHGSGSTYCLQNAGEKL